MAARKFPMLAIVDVVAKIRSLGFGLSSEAALFVGKTVLPWLVKDQSLFPLP